MTVKELREQLAGAPDDMQVLTYSWLYKQAFPADITYTTPEMWGVGKLTKPATRYLTMDEFFHKKEYALALEHGAIIID